ncbi:MAG: Smr/MutS family protein [Mariprofundaceae bacterium]
MSDEELFSKAMSIVRPIAKSDKANIEKSKPGKAETHKKIGKKLPSTTLPSSSHSHAAPETTEEPWILKSSGISQEKLKQLGSGRPPINLETDLHGMTRNEALSALEKMLEIALTEQHRVLCIVHGRGLHSQGKPVLKETVYQWLRSGPYASHILAAIPKPYTGGGSCLVLLRRDRSS